jgi:hypothetical protein
MPAVTIKNRKWDVDGDGIACITVPGMPSEVTTLVNSKRLDGEISNQTKTKDRLTARIAGLQAELDTVTTVVTGLTTLRATVTAEPPPA